ncbi:hypothetical protein CAPTEDRAFT_213801 [Capitella teleta]|uniref:Uncharacterized protein n=1 Tax=Capitella teleta TaxID=283909 RepID=R7UG43_CAPTE|nr:hypothetical protein CAPTEDRAFT_213801 [Capitella teleta]|eukprot:ELU02262.1 hypothetical protein CAPTEDRAFT_213801 [Capitella teleta]
MMETFGLMNSLSYFRDNYDKAVKARSQKSASAKGSGQKPRKPNVSMYVPPSVRNTVESPPTSRETPHHQENHLLFKFEFEDQNGRVHDYHIKKGSNILQISQDLGQRLHMTAPMVLALANFLKLEVKKTDSS